MSQEDTKDTTVSSSMDRVVHHDDSAAASTFAQYLDKLTSKRQLRSQAEHSLVHQDAPNPFINVHHEDHIGEFVTRYWKWIVTTYVVALLISIASIYLNTLPHKVPFVLRLVNLINSIDDKTEYNRHSNPYLQGIFEPVRTEHFHIPVEIIEGEFPAHFEGLFLRVAPNPLTADLHRSYHIFDGHGMIHALRVQNGKAHYTNQWIQTNKFQLATKYNQSVLQSPGEFRKGWMGFLKAMAVEILLEFTFRLHNYEIGSANTALLYYEGKIFACHERSLPFEIAWLEHNHSFASVGYQNFQGALSSAVTAHSKHDPVDQHVYFNMYGLHWFEQPMRAGKWFHEQVESFFPITTAKRDSFSHDMAITENYMIVVESSLVFDNSGKEMLKFDKNRRLRLGVIPKNATSEKDVMWFQFDRAFGLVHILNSWEEMGGEEIVLFAPLTEGFNASTMKSESWKVFELRLNLNTKATYSEVIPGSPSVEFPNVHPKFTGRRSKFAYAARFANAALSFDHIEKINLFSRKFERQAIKLPDGFVCGEPVIIPKGDLSDDVYLAVNAIHPTTLQSQWMMFDGKTMNPRPVVRLRISHRVPMGFHGLWIAEQDLITHLEIHSQAKITNRS